MKETVIWLRREAPTKPKLGAPCNGCGVCCAVGPCPVALVFLWQRRGGCRALEWDESGRRYRCGMAARPQHYLHPPRLFRTWLSRLMLRWIAAGQGCDASDEIHHSQR